MLKRVPESRTGRSVADYDSQDALRKALHSMERQPSSTVSSQAAYADPPIAKSETIDSISGIIVDHLESNLDWVVDNYDKEASYPRDLETELRRLAVLKSYRLIGTGRNSSYERLISMVGRVMKCPMAQVSVIDLGRTYYLASRGMGNVQDHPRKTSMCAHAIISKLDLIVVPDLAKDDRFKDHHYVEGHPHLRFFAAVPLNSPEGYRLGTLSIMDTKPRPEGLSFHEKQSFREIADMVMDVMIEHRESKNHEYRQPAQLIACTSNDLITPLKGVLSGLAALEQDKELQDSLTTQQKDLISTAYTCSSVMSRMCRKSIESFQREAADVSEFGRGNRKDNKESILNVEELVTHLHTVMEPFPKQVPLVITTAPSVPDVVVADDLKVFRSAINYLTNACAKTKIGSVHLKIYLRDDEDSEEAESQNLVFSVEDTGPGISVDKYRYLFQPVVEDSNPLGSYCVEPLLGSTTSAASKTKIQTGGLGLYSVATQIRSIGGKYGFRPRGFTEYGSQCYDPSGEPLKGSVFWFSIPLVLPSTTKEDINGSVKPSLDMALIQADETAGAADETETNAHRKRSFEESEDEAKGDRKMRALLIEDSEVSRKSMRRMLTKLGFEVVEAENGMNGLKALHVKLFDIVFCDFLMPVMDGMECVRQYRQFEVAHRPWFDQFVVGMSAHAGEEDVERALKAGMNDYRSKPVTTQVVKEIMESPEFQYNMSRLDDFSLDDEEDSVEDPKRQKTEELESDGEAVHVCLVATEQDSSISTLADKISDLPSWKAVAVSDGEAALRLLQMRKWDAVLLDDELPGLTSSRCIAHFRDWEQKNRVNKQKNVIQISSSFIPTRMEASSSMQLPAGFDGALGKPLSFKVLQSFLHQAQKDSVFSSIVGT
jgi:CheY-like chemotaxis protein/signal transduction histidine kinase